MGRFGDAWRALTGAQPPAPQRTDADDIEDALSRVETAAIDRVPDVVRARIERIAAVVRETVPRIGNLGPYDAQARDVLRTATSYLPEALGAYLRLPREYADRRPVSNGKTSLTVLCDQLDLLVSKMNDVQDAVNRADADALIAHGRFLAARFGSGDLALDPQRR